MSEANMEDIIELNNTHSPGDLKLDRIYSQFGTLLNELKKKELPSNIISLINDTVHRINASTLEGASLGKMIKKEQTAVLKQVEKELKIVPKNHYRTLWMLFGFTAFGLPIGTILGLITDNMGLLGAGLPIGMGIGLVLGSEMDKKAFKEGRQLDVEIKY